MRKSTILHFFTVLILYALLVLDSLGGELIDEFSSPQLDEELWVMEKVGDASFEIKDGKLILSSPKPSDGIILYYANEVNKPGFSLETKLDSSGIVDSGYVTTMKIMTPPVVSNILNPLRLGQFRLKPDSWRVRDEDIQTILDGDVRNEMHTYKIELDEDTLRFYFDGAEVAEIPKAAETRFFAVSPDPYADDYSGELVIEYIKLSAPWIVAVDAAGRLATSWGSIKAKAGWKRYEENVNVDTIADGEKSY